MRNKTMRAAALLLALTFVTSSFVGGTFAKYTSTDNASDNARVAYWGFGSNAMAELDLFDASYTDVVSDDTTNVVAPGTAKTATLDLTYTPNGEFKAPEVAYKYDVVATPTSTNGYDALDANTNFKWTMTTPAGTTAEYATVAELVAAINATSEAVVNPNTLPAGYAEDGSASYTIGWKWVFDTTGDATQDATDTAMGNDITPDDVTIKIDITATQLDTTPIQ